MIVKVNVTVSLKIRTVSGWRWDLELKLILLRCYSPVYYEVVRVHTCTLVIEFQKRILSRTTEKIFFSISDS